MAFEPINPPQFPTPIAPYSAGAKAGNVVYVSGVRSRSKPPARPCRMWR
jgi:enamine deaminase RidA (YjgF/YER057c/UK114 family)